jgi:aspartate carbamoyltransferase catalytic subunit
MKQLSVEHLLGIKYLNKNDIDLIFETANHFKEVINRPIKKVPSLRDITIANLFFENSTRTKLSFELAEKRLSADVINFSANQSSVKKGESLIDTALTLNAMNPDILIVRHNMSGVPYLLSEKVNCSVINAGDGSNEHLTKLELDVHYSHPLH